TCRQLPIESLAFEATVGLDSQRPPGAVPNPNGAHVSAQQLNRARENIIEGLPQVMLEPKASGGFVQTRQRGAPLGQLRLTLALLCEQRCEKERVKCAYYNDQLGAAHALCDRHSCVAKMANAEARRRNDR